MVKYNKIRELARTVSGAPRRRVVTMGVVALVLCVFALARFAAPARIAGAGPGAELESAPDPTEATPAAEALASAPSASDPAPVAEPEPSPIDIHTTDPGVLFAFAPITDGVPRVTKPAAVRGLYLNAWAAGSTRKLDKLIDIANRTEINTFVIDVKEGGEISYRSRVPLARSIGADRQYIRDVKGMLRRLHENGIYPIARIVVFKDGNLAKARPDWSVRHVNGGEWVDNDGYRWVDSYNRNVWDYNIAIAREALELGFSEVQWDYVRFPDVPRALMRTAAWPAAEGRTKAAGIREFLLYSRKQLASYNAPVTADVFGLTVSVQNDMGIGQLWEQMLDATDVLLPMIYPSHFAKGSYGIAHPNAQPFAIVKTALDHAVRRTRGVSGAATIRPWLQDFTLGKPRYTAAHVRAQIDAVYAAGLEEWVLWHPGSNYTVAALARADGTAPRFGRPDSGAVTPPATPTPAAPRRSGPLGKPVGG